MTVAVKTSGKVSAETKAVIAQTIREILDDPDFGLELTAKAKKRLRQSGQRGKTFTSAEIRKRHY